MRSAWVELVICSHVHHGFTVVNGVYITRHVGTHVMGKHMPPSPRALLVWTRFCNVWTELQFSLHRRKQRSMLGRRLGQLSVWRWGAPTCNLRQYNQSTEIHHHCKNKDKRVTMCFDLGCLAFVLPDVVWKYWNNSMEMLKGHAHKQACFSHLRYLQRSDTGAYVILTHFVQQLALSILCFLITRQRTASRKDPKLCKIQTPAYSMDK